jgi:hypothetical protein
MAFRPDGLKMVGFVNSPTRLTTYHIHWGKPNNRVRGGFPPDLDTYQVEIMLNNEISRVGFATVPDSTTGLLTSPQTA